MPGPSNPESSRFSRADQELQDRVQAERAEYSRRETNDYPQRVRHETRWQTYELVINIAPNFWDRYSGMHFNNSLLEKAKEVRDGLLSPTAKKVLAIDKEPWTTPPALSQEEKMYLEKIKGKKQNEITVIEEEVDDLREPLLREIERAYQEYELITGKVVPLWFAMKGWSSSRSISDDYTRTPINYLISPRDYVFLGNLPPRIMETKELGTRPGGKAWESTYTEEELKVTLKELGLEENVPLGKGIDRTGRIKYLQSLSFTPDKIVDWMARAKAKAPQRVKAQMEIEIDEAFKNKKLIEKRDSDEVLLFPEGHPIYSDRGKYGEAYWSSHREEYNQRVKDAWWIQFGFKDEEEGKKYIGDPLAWIPFLARRGKETTDYSFTFLKPQRRIEIQKEIENLRRVREELANPLTSRARRNELINGKGGLKELTDKLRELMTVIVKNPETGKNERKTLFESLSLENQLDLRKPLTSLGVIEAIPQRAGPKSQVLDTELYKFAKGDKQAAELGKMLHTLWGFGSKYGFYARDFDPEKFKENGFFKGITPSFAVEVEGWPYSEELVKWMTFVFWQMYKREASGPEASRGRFGPFSSDFLSHAIYKEHRDPDDPQTEELFIIIDENGIERPGLPEEGMVIGDMSKSLLDLWEEGTPFGELPFEKLEESEDLSRRWLLRHWFGGGREEDSLMKILTDKKPDPKELVSPFFRDALKLAIKVTMKPYLFKEMIWRDVTKLLDEQFEGDITWLREQLKKTENPEQRRQIFKKYATEEVEITEDGKTVMEGGKPKKRKRLTYDEWQKARKDRIDDYIIAWWWEGVISTHDFDSWAHTLVEYGEKEPLTIGAGVSFMPKELIPTWLEVVRVFGEGGIKLRKPFPITKLGAGLVGGVKKEVTVPADPRPNWINISIDPNP